MLDKIKAQLKEGIMEGETFSYWLENDFPDVFMSTLGKSSSFEVHIADYQLDYWNLEIDDVKKHLENEGFITFETSKGKTSSRNFFYTFKIEIPNLRSFVKEINFLKRERDENKVKPTKEKSLNVEKRYKLICKDRVIEFNAKQTGDDYLKSNDVHLKFEFGKSNENLKEIKERAIGGGLVPFATLEISNISFSVIAMGSVCDTDYTVSIYAIRDEELI